MTEKLYSSDGSNLLSKAELEAIINGTEPWNSEDGHAAARTALHYMSEANRWEIDSGSADITISVQDQHIKRLEEVVRLADGLYDYNNTPTSDKLVAAIAKLREDGVME